MSTLQAKLLISAGSALLFNIVKLPETNRLITGSLCPTDKGILIGVLIFFIITYLSMWSSPQSSGLKLKFTIYGTLLFFLISSPVMFSLTRSLFGNSLTDSSGCPTNTGVIIHSLVYMLALVGLMYLLKKHGDKVSTTLGKNYTQNEELCKLYKNMGMIMNKQCEFINFEMVWIDYKLYMTNNFSDLFNQCLKSKSQFIIIPLGIEMKNGSHANYLIYDKNIGEIERFEPHGGTMPYGFNYSSHLLDGILSDYFKSIKHDIVYVSPNEYIPRIGFQIMDALEDDKRKIGDPSGFCALWSIWYTDYRITYSNYSRDKLINALFKSIKNNNVSYRNMIRNYSAPIINERDELLKKVGLDINDWLNDNYTNNQLDKFISLLLQEINKCCINR